MSLSLYQRHDQAPAAWQHYAPVDHFTQTAPLTTIGDVWSTALDDALIRNPTASLGRMLQRFTDDSEMLSPEEANERFGITLEGEARLSFTEPVRLNTARQLYELKQEELARQYVLSRAPQNLFTGGTQLLAGFVGSFFDPINLAASAIPVTWLAKIGQGGAQAVRLTQTARTLERARNLMQTNTAARIAGQAVEGAFGNALVEPAIYFGAIQEQADYGLQDSLMSLVFGAGMGATFAGAGALFRQLAPETRLMAARAIAADADPAQIKLAIDAIDPNMTPLAAARNSPLPPDAATAGDFGPIYWEHRGDTVAAIQRLMKEQTGEVPKALYHKEIGFIDLIWGEPDVIVDGKIVKEGYGLAHIIQKHVEFQKDLTIENIFNLQNLIQDSIIISRSDNRIVLANESYQAVVRLSWDNKKKTWLMTFYEETKSGSPINTTVNDEPPTGGNGFSLPLTTNDNLNAQTKNINNLFSDSNDISPLSPQIDSAQTLADQQAHLQRSQQETSSFREQKLKELYQSFAQPRTQATTAPHAAIPDTSQKIADLQNLISQKQDALSRADTHALPPALRQELDAELKQIQTAKNSLLENLRQFQACVLGV